MVNKPIPTLMVPPESLWGWPPKRDVRRVGRCLGLAIADRNRSAAFMAPSNAIVLAALCLSTWERDSMVARMALDQRSNSGMVSQPNLKTRRVPGASSESSPVPLAIVVILASAPNSETWR